LHRKTEVLERAPKLGEGREVAMASGTVELHENQSWTLRGNPLMYLRLAELAFKSVHSSLRCAEVLLDAKSTSEINDAVTDNVRDQFEALSEQIEELSALIAPEAVDIGLSFWD
jgi:hypothetical protein